MRELHFPWLECSILAPAVGAIVVKVVEDRQAARNWSILFATLALLFALGEWIDFSFLNTFEAHDQWSVVEWLFHRDVFVVDELSAPLLPLGACIYFVTILSTMRTKVQRFSFAWSLASESLLLATFSCRTSWVLVALLVAALFPPWLEMRRRGQVTRVYVWHMGLFASLLIGGYTWLSLSHRVGEPALLASALLSAAGLVRSGLAPLHCWITDLFEKATFGTALLFVTPLTGAYTIMRFVLPIAPDAALHVIAVFSLITAVYAAGMAMIQTEARRFFCYLFLSNASLVLCGLELVTPIGLTGALCVWLSIGLALTGLGLVLRSLEARLGRLALDSFHGLFDQMPNLAGFFLLTGLASIGFPGTIGFVALELLIEGAVGVYPLIGTAVVVASALNGISILQVYFRIFTGRRNPCEVSLQARPAERVAIWLLSGLILGGGLWPQPGVASRHHAALELNLHREAGTQAPLFRDASPMPSSPSDPSLHSKTNHRSQP
jgi:NADH-quinone oxidoreductase subunit M